MSEATDKDRPCRAEIDVQVHALSDDGGPVICLRQERNSKASLHCQLGHVGIQGGVYLNRQQLERLNQILSSVLADE